MQAEIRNASRYRQKTRSAGNPHLQTVDDAERLARANKIEFQTLWVGSAWWPDNDAFVTVAGNSRARVERALIRAMRDAAIDAYNSSEPEDKRKVKHYLAEIECSGVDTMPFDSIIPRSVIDAYETAYSTNADGVCRCPDMEYSDYEMLRDGRKDVVVYL